MIKKHFFLLEKKLTIDKLLKTKNNKELYMQLENTKIYKNNIALTLDLKLSKKKK